MSTKSEELQRRTKDFAVRVVKFCRTLPNNEEGRTVGGQLLSAGTSVAANYRAACRARSHAEFVSRICVVLEEAEESMLWLEVIRDTRMADSLEVQSLHAETVELVAIFAASHRTAKINARISGVRPRRRQAP